MNMFTSPTASEDALQLIHSFFEMGYQAWTLERQSHFLAIAYEDFVRTVPDCCSRELHCGPYPRLGVATR